MSVDFSKWDKVDQTRLSKEQLLQVIEACKTVHHDRINVGMACGIRAAVRILAGKVPHSVPSYQVIVQDGATCYNIKAGGAFMERRRIEFPGAFYHVTQRGNNRENIFYKSGDKQYYLT